MKDNEKGRKEHNEKDADSQPKGYGKSEHTPGIKMGSYATGTEHHDCSHKGWEWLPVLVKSQ